MKIARDVLANPVLSVDENFATLIDIEDDGTFVYEFRYMIAPFDALKNNAQTVRVSIRRAYPAPVIDAFNAARKTGNLKPFISDVLTLNARTKDAKRADGANIIATDNSDITSALSNSLAKNIATSKTNRDSFVDANTSKSTRNDMTTGLSQGVPAPRGSNVGLIKTQSPSNDVLGSKRMIELRTVSDLRASNITPNIQQSMLFSHASSPTAQQAKAAAANLLRQGIDPSIAGNKFTCINGTNRTMSGIGHIARMPGNISNTKEMTTSEVTQGTLVSSLYSPSDKHVDFNALHDNDLVPIVVNAPIKKTLNFKTMKVSQQSIGNEDFIVTFELVTGDDIVIETLLRAVKHESLVRAFNTPKVPPTVSISPMQKCGKNVLEIMQNDPRATGMRVMRRIIWDAEALSMDATYELIAELSMKKSKGVVKFVDNVDNTRELLYRCIPVGHDGTLCSEFTNAVAPAVRQAGVNRPKRSIAAVMHSRLVPGSIQLSVTSVPVGVTAVAVTRRDCTLFETKQRFIDVTQPVKQVTGVLGPVDFLDNNVKNGHIYEYKCELFYVDGFRATSSANAIQRYTAAAVDVIEIEIDDFKLTRDNKNIDVTFSVTSNIANENLDDVKSALKSQGLDQLFIDTLADERDKFQSLIAHSIERVDITTGQRVNLGTLVDKTFVDSKASAKMSAPKLEDGHRYRYVIGTLLRKAETMFNDFEKSSTDATTGKQYKFKPAKYMHPLALLNGTIMTPTMLAANYPEDDFSFGRVGNVRELDVTIDVPVSKVIDVRTTRIDRNVAAVKWSVSGPVSNIEHFIIMKDVLGQSKVAGKTHNISPSKTFEFFDIIDPDDIGEVTYKVLPVMGNYERGVSVGSNKLKVEDMRNKLRG